MSPYTYGPHEFDASGGELTVVELRVPARGEISSIQLDQIAGDLVAGSFRILTSRAAALSLVGSSSSEVLPGGNPNQYSVFGNQPITDGHFAVYGQFWPYRNKDGSQSVQVRRLWLVLDLAGTGEKTFSITMGIRTGLAD